MSATKIPIVKHNIPKVATPVLCIIYFFTATGATQTSIMCRINYSVPTRRNYKRIVLISIS